jgi:broad specificity polyphosphatase/5'/3'-nucleotidase SurE
MCLQGVPAIALSLADHKAKQQEHYSTSAALAVALIEAMLDGLSSGCSHHQRAFEAGCVINVNFPAEAAGPTAGLALTHQGTGCVFPKVQRLHSQQLSGLTYLGCMRPDVLHHDGKTGSHNLDMQNLMVLRQHINTGAGTHML